MKIKLALLDNDQNYLNRIVSVFNIRYADKLEIYSFTRIESALSALESTRIDVFVSSVAFDVNTAALPKRCGFAYFVDSADIDSVNNQRAICKYQKADLILTRPPKVRPKKSNFGGRYFYVKIQL